MNDGRSDAALVISAISLGVSALTLWLSRLSPALITVSTANRVEITTDPWSPEAKRPALLVSIVAFNSGAKPAVVSDLAVSYSRPGSREGSVLFRSTHEKLDDTMNIGGEKPPPRLRPFTSFVIGPSQQVSKTALLIPQPPDAVDRFYLGPVSLTTQLLLAGEQGEWVAAERVTFDISSADLAIISQISATPTPDGGRYVNWFTHSIPTRETNDALTSLASELRNH